MKKSKAAAHWKNALLVAISGLIGCAGFTASPRAAALILAVPVLWTLADSRYSAFAVILAYKLAASRGLIHSAAVFLSENHTLLQAAILYFGLSFGASLPFLVFWSKDKKRKAICLVLAFVTAYVLPPISLIGIVNPLMASGVIFRGWGFVGILAILAIYIVCAVSRKTAYAFLCATVLFSILPGWWYEPGAPSEIIALDMSFGRLGSGSFNFTRDYERVNIVLGELQKRSVKQTDEQAKIIALPETIAGRLNTIGLSVWRDRLSELLPEKTVIFGAELPTGDGRKYDNVALMLYKGEISISRQRIPVPYSMYRGPFAKSGANLHLFDDGILAVPDGNKLAVVICYEAFLTWPLFVSMSRSPDVIICLANLWWCKGTSLPTALTRAVSLWALTFGVPVVFAKNI